jgi:hypothetical protein
MMQALLTTRADELASETGFIQRRRQVSGANFVQTTTFSFLANPASTRHEVRQAAASAGLMVSTPGLDKRFTARAAYFLDRVLAEAVQQVVAVLPQSHSLLARFAGVYVSDSTSIALPPALAGVFAGCNGPSDAAVKLAVQWELGGGGLRLFLSDGRLHDQRTGVMAQGLPAGSLRLADLGFFNLDTFEADALQGVYFFSRYKVGTSVYRADGQVFELLPTLRQQPGVVREWTIGLGARRLPCRLMALPVSPDQVRKRRQRLRQQARRKQQPVSQRALALAAWTLYVTNVPPALLQVEEAAIVGCTRWQIECLFKLWKSSGRLDETRSHNPHRVWCEFYAKLLALLITHWLSVIGCWQRLDRSLYRAMQVIRKRAFALLDALTTSLPAFIRSLRRTAHLLATTCGLSKRAAHPLTFQHWLETANG